MVFYYHKKNSHYACFPISDIFIMFALYFSHIQQNTRFTYFTIFFEIL